ncbi:MAG: VanZ family protein [Verrucomicrobiota bacterium]|nr:VanZ family protein [Verrucomicrobiota bacterium]
MPRPRLPACRSRSPFWSTLFLLWGIVLWLLSDGPIPMRDGPDFPGFDKILHFGYFFGGAGLLSAALYLHGSNRPGLSWRRLVITVVIVLATVGALDEWHQSWIPERSGNDFGDWLADIAGALTGALVFKCSHHLLGQPAPDRPSPEDLS